MLQDNNAPSNQALQAQILLELQQANDLAKNTHINVQKLASSVSQPPDQFMTT